MAVTIKTKAQVAANRAANNARIAASNAKAGKTAEQQAAADASALASMNKVRESQGLAPQTSINEKAPSRAGVLSIDKSTNEVKDSSGNVVYKGASLQDALAVQTKMSSGAAPTVSGRPDLFATAPDANQRVESFFDTSTQTTVNPRTITPEEANKLSAGTLESFNAAQGLTYLDGKTFKELQPYLNEKDLIRTPDGQIWLRQGLTPDAVRARAETAVSGTVSGANGNTLATDFAVDVPSEISTDLIDELTADPVTDTEFATLMDEIQAQQDELIGLLRPSDYEQQIKAQINSIKADIEKTLTELSMGLNNVEDQPIAMQFITGQQASIQRNAEAKLQNLARIESNLLNELGLAQEARQVEATVAQTKLGYLQTNLDTAFKVRSMIQADEDRLFNRAMALKTDARNTLSFILDSFQGVRESDLTSDQQKQLQDLAINSGIPYSLITEGMNNVANRLYESESLSFSDYTSDYKDYLLRGGEAGLGVSFNEWMTGRESQKSGSTLTTDDISKTSEAKKLSGLNELTRALGDYQSLIEQYGTAGKLQPGQRQELDNAKQSAVLAAKNAYELGALTEADTSLVNGLLPSVTSEDSWFVNPLKKGQALNTLERYTTSLQKDIDSNYSLLISRGANVASDPYVQELANQLNIDTTKYGTQDDITKFLNGIDGGDEIDNILNSIKPQSYDLQGTIDTFKGNIIGSIRPSTSLATASLGNKNVTMNSEAAWRLAAADNDYYLATGKHIPVSEAFRSSERQRELYKKLSARGARVAPPGYSFHELGMAVDVGDSWSAVKPYLNKYGFVNGLSNDMGHFSIGEIG